MRVLKSANFKQKETKQALRLDEEDFSADEEFSPSGYTDSVGYDPEVSSHLEENDLELPMESEFGRDESPYYVEQDNDGLFYVFDSQDGESISEGFVSEQEANAESESLSGREQNPVDNEMFGNNIEF